jgi:CheY-like chemotaxis protein
MLESIGFKRNKITHAHDGQEALEKAREKMFDLILMDWYTSPRHLRSLHPTPHL